MALRVTWRLCTAALIALGSSLGPAHALAADSATARLDYHRGDGAADCPGDRDLRDAVRARLGYDPFREQAEVVLEASVDRSGEELRGRLVLVVQGDSPAEREFVSRRADCSELGAALALAIALAIDPLSQPPAPEAVPPPPAPEPERAPMRVPVPAAPWRKSFRLTVGVVGAVGSEPAPTVGLDVGVGLRVADVSLSLEGRVDLPASTPAAGGRVSASLGVASLVPCYHLGPFGACLLASVGGLRSSGEGLAASRQATTLAAAVGARALFEYPSGPFALQAHLDVLVPLVRNTLAVGGEPVWSSSPVAAALGVGGRLDLP